MKNTLTKLALAGTLGLFSSGCNIEQTRIEQSNVLHEGAVVADLVYSPSNHGSGVGPTIDFDGNLGIAITGVDIPQKYAVVFKCQHGKFVIEGTSQKYKTLWERFSEGDSVDVTYRENYRTTYKDLNGDGKKDLVRKTLIDYDFLDAQKK